MNVIALMSRGYLCGGFRLIPDLNPPSVRVEAVQPSVTKAKIRKPGAPSGTARTASPSIRGATESPAPSAPGAPSITGGRVTRPTIRKAKKD